MSLTRNLFINALWEIRSEDKWCQSDYAQNAKGDAVFVRDDDACRFCSVGAMEKASGSPFGMEISDLMDRFEGYIRPINNDHGLIKFNDNHTYKKVIDTWIRFGVEQGYLPEGFKMKQLKELRDSL